MMTSVFVAAHSMVSALGDDAPTACAAARAGLVRVSRVDGMRFVSSVDGEPAEVLVHAEPCLTRGFEGLPRLERLLAGALKRLRETCPVDLVESASLGFYLSVPDPRRTSTGLALMAPEGFRREAEQAVRDAASEPLSLDEVQALFERALRWSGWPTGRGLRHVSLAGHAGVAHGVAVAAEDLRTAQVQLAIVVGLDSLVDQATLEWLQACGRLKLPDMPVGLRPGEACAALALVHASHAHAAACDVEIRGVEAAAEERHLLSGGTSVGLGLAEAITRALPATGWQDGDAAWLVCDHNGEVHRANEWGCALVRLREHHAVMADPQVWLPAEAFGDTGAASGAVGLTVVLEAMARSCSPGPVALLVSASESAMRSAMVLASRRPAHVFHGGAYGRP